MAEILQYPKDRIIVLKISEDELDKLLEIALVQEATLNEVILSCFLIGIMKLVAKTMQDKLHI